ncbi:MAG TPA: sigma-70 family RNA polymerase sigma factor [Candidatus Angelobacter sp.]|jgi:RNA polymerase sigma-70 factor (ECF subfamily)
MASPSILSSFEFNAMYINSLRQGDPSTENHFVSHFGPILFKKLRRKLRSTDQAHDLRQETFLRVLTLLRSKQGVRNPERFEILVLGVCNNVLMETYRQQKRLVQMAPEFDLASHASGPDDYVLAGEAGNYVKKMMERLDTNDRAILQAVFLEEQDRDEICRRFNITRSYLRLLIYRAKKTFGACAQKDVTGNTKSATRRPRRGRRIFNTIKPWPVAAENPGLPCTAPMLLPTLPVTSVPEELCFAESAPVSEFQSAAACA